MYKCAIISWLVQKYLSAVYLLMFDFAWLRPLLNIYTSKMQYLLVSDQSDLYRYLLINGQILFPIFQLKTRPPIGWHTGSTNQSPWFPIDLNMIWPLIFRWNLMKIWWKSDKYEILTILQNEQIIMIM